MKVEILGPGCANCQKLEDLVKEVIEDLDRKDIDLKKVEDPGEIASRGVLNSPALVVDEDVEVSGRVPSKEEISEILR